MIVVSFGYSEKFADQSSRFQNLPSRAHPLPIRCQTIISETNSPLHPLHPVRYGWNKI
jgi:hypothetical protein